MQSANWGDNCVTILGTFGLFYASWKINAKVSFLICITRLSNIECIGIKLEVRELSVILFLVFYYIHFTAKRKWHILLIYFIIKSFITHWINIKNYLVSIN